MPLSRAMARDMDKKQPSRFTCRCARVPTYGDTSSEAPMIDEQVDPNDPIARLLTQRYNGQDEAAPIDGKLEPVARMLDGDAADDELAVARSLVASDPSLAAAMRELSHQDAGNVVRIGDRRQQAAAPRAPRRWLYAVAAVAMATLGAMYLIPSAEKASEDRAPTMGAAVGGAAVARVGWDAKSGRVTVAAGGASTLNAVVLSETTAPHLQEANRVLSSELIRLTPAPMDGECQWLVAVLTSAPVQLSTDGWSASAKGTDGTCNRPVVNTAPEGATVLIQRIQR